MSKQENKISSLKKKLDNLDQIHNKKSPIKNDNSLNFGFKISTEIIAALVVGVGIGLIVDKYLNTKPFGLIIFFIFGALAGFLNV